LAAHLPQEIICGLGTLALLAGDVAVNPLLPNDGMVAVREVEVSEELIERYRLPQEQVSNWHNRIDSALQHLEMRQLREGSL
jgi:O-succinylbenzoate synthase